MPDEPEVVRVPGPPAEIPVLRDQIAKFCNEAKIALSRARAMISEDLLRGGVPFTITKEEMVFVDRPDGGLDLVVRWYYTRGAISGGFTGAAIKWNPQWR